MDNRLNNLNELVKNSRSHHATPEMKQFVTQLTNALDGLPSPTEFEPIIDLFVDDCGCKRESFERDIINEEHGAVAAFTHGLYQIASKAASKMGEDKQTEVAAMNPEIKISEKGQKALRDFDTSKSAAVRISPLLEIMYGQ